MVEVDSSLRSFGAQTPALLSLVLYSRPCTATIISIGKEEADPGILPRTFLAYVAEVEETMGIPSYSPHKGTKVQSGKVTFRHPMPVCSGFNA